MSTRLMYISEYPFAKYNVQTPNYTYSQDEYMRFLEGVPGSENVYYS